MSIGFGFREVDVLFVGSVEIDSWLSISLSMGRFPIGIRTMSIVPAGSVSVSVCRSIQYVDRSQLLLPVVVSIDPARSSQYVDRSIQFSSERLWYWIPVECQQMLGYCRLAQCILNFAVPIPLTNSIAPVCSFATFAISTASPLARNGSQSMLMATVD
jgi:hypothetical protein